MKHPSSLEILGRAFATLLVLVALPATSSCQSDSLPTDRATPTIVQAATERGEVTSPSEEAGDGPISLTWSVPDRALMNGDSIEVVVENNTPETRELDITFLDAGRDGKQREAALADLKLEPKTAQVVRVPHDRLRAATESNLGFAAVTATFYEGKDSHVVSTAPLYVSTDGEGVRVVDALTLAHSERGLADSPDDARLLATGAEGLTGVVLVRAGEELFAAPAAPPSPMATGKVTTMAGFTVRFCSTWRVYFPDSGYGDDSYGTGWINVAARFARAYVLTASTNQLYWQGYLDGSGCTPPLTLPANTYKVQQATSSISNGSANYQVYRLDNNVEYHHEVWATATWNNTASQTIIVNPGFNNEAIQVASVASKLLFANGIVNFGMPVGTYKTVVNKPCPFAGSCNYASEVRISLPNTSGYGGSNSKYIIAHEFGHQIEYRAYGGFSANFSETTPVDVCRCHVDTTVTNDVHCMQSLEQSNAAQQEGLAHYTAAVMWNDWTQTNCSFAYYKTFKNANGTLTQPPMAKECFTYVKWLETYCQAPDRGVEWDWLIFYFRISSGALSAASRITIQERHRLYRRACTGSPMTNCNTVSPQGAVNWTSLSGAAIAEFGVGTQKANNFEAFGVAAGVDN
jgi:hypothetical protein